MHNVITLKADPDWEIDGIGYREEASNKVALRVINQPVNQGRSQFYWFRLSSGDLILGVYPQADIYEETELDRTI